MVVWSLRLIFDYRQWARHYTLNSVGPRINNVPEVIFESGLLETIINSEYDNKPTKQVI